MFATSQARPAHTREVNTEDEGVIVELLGVGGAG